MKTFSTLILAGVISAVTVAAHPGHGHIAQRASNGTFSDGNSTSIADDHIPTFQTADCVCPDPVCDPRMNEQSVSPVHTLVVAVPWAVSRKPSLPDFRKRWIPSVPYKETIRTTFDVSFVGTLPFGSIRSTPPLTMYI